VATGASVVAGASGACVGVLPPMPHARLISKTKTPRKYNGFNVFPIISTLLIQFNKVGLGVNTPRQIMAHSLPHMLIKSTKLVKIFY
jgi:hypothetical protein